MMIFVRPSAIAVDKVVLFDSAAGTNGGNGGGVTSLTWNQPVSSDDTGIIVLASFNTLREITATCSGIQMMPITTMSSGTNNYLAVFALFGLSSGNKTIVITANASSNRMQGQSAAYKGATSFKIPAVIAGTTANTPVSSPYAAPLVVLLSNNGSVITAGTDTLMRDYQSSDGNSGGPKGAILEGTNAVNATYSGTWSLAGINIVGKEFDRPPGRVQKTSGTQTLANNGWRLITGWSISTGYESGTSVLNDAFTVIQSGDYTIVGNDQRLGSDSTTACRLLVNGVVVATSTSGTSLSVAKVDTMYLNAGDIITMEGFTNTSGTAPRQTGNAGTYIQILPSSGIASIGMQMSADQTLTSFNQDVTLTNMIVRSGFTGTIQNNGLVASVAGLVSVQGLVSWNYDYGIHRVKIFKKRAGADIMIFDSGVQTYPGGLKSVPFNFTTDAEANDNFYMTMNADQNFAGSGIVTNGSYITLQYL